MSSARLRSERDMHRWEKRWLVWNRSSWTQLDRRLRRAERRTARVALEQEQEQAE